MDLRTTIDEIVGDAPVDEVRWGKFGNAIKLWENLLERKFPVPVRPTGRNGKYRLCPRFVEWMMGLPDGWVTNIGIPRKEEMKALGNGVVPQQAAYALADMKNVFDKESK